MDLGFSIDDIHLYLLAAGGKVDYHQLVKDFKHVLSQPQTQAEARVKFKDFVNTLATVSQQDNKKYLVLRPNFQHIPNVPKVESNANNMMAHNMMSNNMMPNNMMPNSMIPNNMVTNNTMTNNTMTNTTMTNNMIAGDINSVGLPIVEKRRSHSLNYGDCLSSPGVGMNSASVHHNFADSPNYESYHVWSQQFDDNSCSPPRPPPRRRSSTGGAKAKLEERLKQFHEETPDKENENVSPLHQQEKLKEIHELTAKTPGRVKEHAQKINKMASESELKPPMPLSTSNVSLNRKKSSSSKDDDTDSGSVQPLDPLRRRWMMNMSNCDYNELVSLLKEEPKLAGYKDFTSGYSALHWAAKFGKPEIIKLIAGTYSVNPNIKSNGGFTPLHLAAMHNHQQLMELLINTYNADPNIRDHCGKRPSQYLPQKSVGTTSKSNKSGVNSIQRKINDSRENLSSLSFRTTLSSPIVSSIVRNHATHQSLLVRRSPTTRRVPKGRPETITIDKH